MKKILIITAIILIYLLSVSGIMPQMNNDIDNAYKMCSEQSCDIQQCILTNNKCMLNCDGGSTIEGLDLTKIEDANEARRRHGICTTKCLEDKEKCDERCLNSISVYECMSSKLSNCGNECKEIVRNYIDNEKNKPTIPEDSIPKPITEEEKEELKKPKPYIPYDFTPKDVKDIQNLDCSDFCKSKFTQYQNNCGSDSECLRYITIKTSVNNCLNPCENIKYKCIQDNNCFNENGNVNEEWINNKNKEIKDKDPDLLTKENIDLLFSIIGQTEDDDLEDKIAQILDFQEITYEGNDIYIKQKEIEVLGAKKSIPIFECSNNVEECIVLREDLSRKITDRINLLDLNLKITIEEDKKEIEYQEPVEITGIPFDFVLFMIYKSTLIDGCYDILKQEYDLDCLKKKMEQEKYKIHEEDKEPKNVQFIGEGTIVGKI